MSRLSAFADEISPDLATQIAVLRETGIALVELRSVWETNVLDLSDAQLEEILAAFGKEGIAVSAIGSPLGKVPVDTPLEDELRRLRRAIEVARRCGTALIRIFAFYAPEHGGSREPAGYRGQVLERLRPMTRLAAEHGITLLLENDTDLYADTAERCRDVLEAIDSPHLRAAFDPANFIVSGDTPFPDAYELLRPWLAHVHVKDARPDRTVVAAGEGVGRWPELLARLQADGYEGLFSLEPHLAAAGRFQGFSGPDLFRHATANFRALWRESEVASE